MHAGPIGRIGVLAMLGPMHLDVLLHQGLIQVGKERAARQSDHAARQALPLLLQFGDRDQAAGIGDALEQPHGLGLQHEGAIVLAGDGAVGEVRLGRHDGRDVGGKLRLAELEPQGVFQLGVGRLRGQRVDEALLRVAAPFVVLTDGDIGLPAVLLDHLGDRDDYRAGLHLRVRTELIGVGGVVLVDDLRAVGGRGEVQDLALVDDFLDCHRDSTGIGADDRLYVFARDQVARLPGADIGFGMGVAVADLDRVLAQKSAVRIDVGDRVNDRLDRAIGVIGAGPGHGQKQSQLVRRTRAGLDEPRRHRQRTGRNRR